MLLPMGLKLTGKKVIVVGGGPVATRRVGTLLNVGAAVELISPTASTLLETLAETGDITWHKRPWADGDTDGAWLVIAATDKPQVNERITAESNSHRIWAVRSDDATASPAWMSATAHVDGLTIGVNADRNPRRAVNVRNSIETALQNGTLEAHRSNTTPEPTASYINSHLGNSSGSVTLVGAGPGHSGLITVAGLEALNRADVVVTDHLVPLDLLDHLGEGVEIVDASKIPYGRSMAQETINDIIIDRAKSGHRVVRLKGGDGFVFGRGAEEMDACIAAGVSVHVIPGVSSSLAGPIAGGVSVTERGIVHDFTVVSGHAAPEAKSSLVNWEALAAGTGTIVLLMAVKNRAAIARVLIDGGRASETPVQVIENATTLKQSQVQTTLAELGDLSVRSPSVIVIGTVAGRARL